MHRLAPTILALFAVAGLLWPSMPIVHAHADGHDAHDHGRTRLLHVALACDAACPSHEHPHPPAVPPSSGSEPTGDEDGDEDGDRDERHAHAAADSVALGRTRTGLLPPVDGPQGVLDRGAGPCVHDFGERLGDRLGGWTAPPPVPRALDALIALGRLLI
jgi:hypothetical protein